MVRAVRRPHDLEAGIGVWIGVGVCGDFQRDASGSLVGHDHLVVRDERVLVKEGRRRVAESVRQGYGIRTLRRRLLR